MSPKVKYLHFSFSKGVSYVELAVTVAIIGVVASIAIANYVGSEQKQKVVYAIQQIEQDARKMQTLSLAGKKENSNSATPRPCNFGMRFDNNSGSETSYILFKEVELGCDKIYDNSNPDDSQIENSPISLPKDVVIGSIRTFREDGAGHIQFDGITTFGFVDVTYEVPFAALSFLNDPLIARTEIQIKNSSGFNKILIINNKGEVSIGN